MNTLKTIVLMGVLTSIIVSLGYVFGGRSGVTMAFLFAIGTNFFTYWFSGPMALRMNNAIPVTEEQAPQLYQIVGNLTQKAGMPMPGIYIIPSQSPNAFATGRDSSHASVAVTEGLMQMLDYGQLEGVLAHEISHVRNGDILITSIAAVLGSVVTWIGHMGMYGGARDEEDGGVNPVFAIAMAILAPIAASIVQMAISRSREFEADASGARLCGKPLELASALQGIDSAAHQIPMYSNPALSSMYIIKPNPASFLTKMFSTHPPTEERIARLQQMARTMEHDQR